MNKLTEKDRLKIRELRGKDGKGLSLRALGRMFNVTDTSISKALDKFSTDKKKDRLTP